MSGTADNPAGGTAIRPFTIPTVADAELDELRARWVEQGYPALSYFHGADRGGHLAAWEEPELFATEIRAAFKPLRK